MKLSRLLAACACFLYSQLACAFIWPNVPAPPQSTHSNMADEIIINNVEMRITNFESRLSTRQVVAFYRNKWRDKFAESQSGPWQQISHGNKNYFITVQVKDAGFSGSMGRINISKVPDGLPKKKTTVPMMQGSRIANQVITKDKLTTSTMVLLINLNTVDDNVEFYEKNYSQKGWKIIFQKDHQDKNSGVSLVFSKGTDETSVTIKKVKNHSTVILNEVKKRSWFN